MTDDDTRIWRGLRARLDELGQMSPSSDLAAVRERAERGDPVRGISLVSATSIAIAVVLAVAVVGQLGPLAPAAVPGATVSQSPPGPTASSGSPATTPSTAPAISTVCIPWPPYKGAFIPTLTCEAAVEAALGALPTRHPPVTGITVQLGRYCPNAAPCPSDLNLITAYVAITFEGAPAVLVTVRGEPNVPVVVTGIGPLPTPGPPQ